MKDDIIRWSDWTRESKALKASDIIFSEIKGKSCQSAWTETGIFLALKKRASLSPYFGGLFWKPCSAWPWFLRHIQHRPYFSNVCGHVIFLNLPRYAPKRSKPCVKWVKLSDTYYVGVLDCTHKYIVCFLIALTEHTTLVWLAFCQTSFEKKQENASRRFWRYHADKRVNNMVTSPP